MIGSIDGRGSVAAVLPRLGVCAACSVVCLAVCMACPAYACGGHFDSSIVTLPGLGIVGGYVGLALPILAGVMERPFLSVAGVNERTVWVSNLANYLSAVGATFAAVAVFTIPAIGPAFPVLASVGIEWALLRRLTTRPLGLLGMVVLANLMSAVAIGSMPIWRMAFGTDRREYYVHVNRYQAEIGLATVVVAGLVVAWAVYRGGVLLFGRWDRSSVEHQRGFEVILKRPQA